MWPLQLRNLCGPHRRRWLAAYPAAEKRPVVAEEIGLRFASQQHADSVTMSTVRKSGLPSTRTWRAAGQGDRRVLRKLARTNVGRHRLRTGHRRRSQWRRGERTAELAEVAEGSL